VARCTWRPSKTASRRFGRSTGPSTPVKRSENRMIAEALLSKLADWRPAGAGPHFWTAPLDNGWEIALTADEADTLGCRAAELTVRRAVGAAATAAELTQWAVRSAKRITGLLEPLKVIEVDTVRSEALLRSDPPSPRGPQVHYYE